MKNKGVLNLLIILIGVLIANAGCNNCCEERLSNREVAELERAANTGNIAAMKRLSAYFESNEDQAQAAVWRKRAADAGDSEAELAMYDGLKNDHDPRQRDLAIAYLQRSAEHGSSIGQWFLGRICHEGAGVPKDANKAKYWLRKAARSGNEEAIIYLCDIALSERDVVQCRECVDLANRAVASVKPGSYYSVHLEHQRKRITEFLVSVTPRR
jgi:hypothetical protein